MRKPLVLDKPGVVIRIREVRGYETSLPGGHRG